MNRSADRFSQLFFASLLVLSLSRCTPPVNSHLYSSEVDSISHRWIPDKREGISTARLYLNQDKMVLTGKTSSKELKEDIFKFLKSRNVVFTDSLTLLPDTSLIGLPYALINVSVCNMRIKPDHDMEMISQALMGTPVRILEYSDGWYRIQTPDSYIGWVDEDAIVRISANNYAEWKKSIRIIFLEKTGDILSKAGTGEIISDIVSGALLQTDGKTGSYYDVSLPDGRKGLVTVKSCRYFEDWAATAKPETDRLLKTARSLMGTPYLWGGTSVRGLDCSGFMKTVYFLNGIILSRDASLQVRHGIVIDDHKNLKNLQAGDLLFFGKYRKDELRPTHVGMYIGDSEFIHESGMVKINSLDSSRTNFSKFRHDSFLAARRITDAGIDESLKPVSKNKWYF